jgi:hypothetical protein
MTNENFEGDAIDFITTDDNPGWVVLHLIVKGSWADPEDTVHWVRRRLNVYLHYVRTDQINLNPRYRGLAIKFVAHCEYPPPRFAITSFAIMKEHLATFKIELGITVGTDFKTEIPIWKMDPEIDSPPEFGGDDDIDDPA